MIFNSFPDPNVSVILPQNYKRGAEANKYVEQYAKSQRIKQDEALQVQGSDLIIWNRIFTQRYCTCQGLDSVINNNPAITNDERPEVVEQEELKVIESLSKKSSRVKLKEKQALSNAVNNAGLNDLSSIVDSLYDDPIEELETHIQTPKESKKQNSVLEEAFIQQKINLGVEHAEYVNCPICFGTRRADSYQPHRGVRLVLDGSDFYPVSLSGCTLSTDEYPYRFNFFDENSFIVWEVTLPKYFKAVSVKAYNLEHESTSVNLFYAESGSDSFTGLTKDTLQSRSGHNNKLRVKCAYNKNNISDFLSDLKTKISHVEIVMLYVDDFDKGELPMLTIPEQIDYQELYLRSRIVLSPKVESLTRGDLICENKYGLLWQVVDVEKLYTNGGQLLNLRAEIRLIQNSEKMFNLAMFPRKMNTFRTEL